MTILFVILTCDAHKQTRQQWQKDSWLKGVDYVYLDKPVGEETYKNAPLKYVQYIKNADLKHDWYFFCDDDTFVYVDNLKAILYQDLKPTMIGFKGGEFKIYSLLVKWCSGGAGFLANYELLWNVREHLRNNNPIVTDETDISFAVWAAMSSNVLVIDNKRFSPFKPAETPMKDCITYHYCGEQDFKKLRNEK